MVAVITTVGKALPSFDLVNISLLYLLPVLVAAVRWGLWPSLFASSLGILSFDYFFIPPVHSFTVANVGDLLNFAVFLVVALVTGTLAARLRAQASEAEERARTMTAVYTLSRSIAVETDIQQVLRTVVDMVAGTIGVGAAIFMPEAPYSRVRIVASSPNEGALGQRKQVAMAQWAFEHGQQARQSTSSQDDAEALFIPIVQDGTSYAVLALELVPGQALVREQQKDIEAFASLAALAITRVRLANEAEQAKWLLESEKLHAALLNAVSHDLRTPLSSITGAVTGLLEAGDAYDAGTIKALLRSINEGAQRMNRFVTNLLDMARVESGILKPSREWSDMLDIIGVAANRVSDALPEDKVLITAPPELPLVEVDFALIEQVLINLLENAAKYSPTDSTISIDVDADKEQMVVSVADCGPTIPESDRDRVFDKFYRLQSSRHLSGTGLGLSISRAMIEAHGGRLWVEPGADRGNIFRFAVPIGGRQPESLPARPQGDL